MGNKIIFMFNEFILLIAYRACSCKNSVWGKNPFQYESAIRLISILLFIHMSQIALLLIGGLIKSFSKTEYLVALVTLLFLPYLIRLIFSKKIDHVLSHENLLRDSLVWVSLTTAALSAAFCIAAFRATVVVGRATPRMLRVAADPVGPPENPTPSPNAATTTTTANFRLIEFLLALCRPGCSGAVVLVFNRRAGPAHGLSDAR